MVVDTDIIIRFLTGDEPEKADRFEEFLKTRKKITLTDVTFAEIYWTLGSFYKFSKNKVLPTLETLINHSSILCSKKLLQRTLSLLRKYNISFIDAYIISYSQVEDDGTILSYDKGFDKVKSIKRFEPNFPS